MSARLNRFRGSLLASVLGVALVSGGSFARGQGRFDLSPIIAKVKPSVALIQVVENNRILGNGSGFVVSEKGLIATNFHVVDGAKELVVSFPSDKDKRGFKVQGFVGILPTKDMALIMIDPKGRKLTALPLAKELPAQGEPVVAFGAPLGLSDTVTDGIVSAVRTGAELSEMLKRGNHDEYKDSLGYDIDMQWIQTSAPISPGNSGGPLVNARGEVIGINSFVSQMGQNLNFSLSTIHLRELIDKSGTTVQPLSSLPPPRHKHAPGAETGDLATTMDIWKQLNRAKNTLDGKVADVEKKLGQIPELDPRNPVSAHNKRNKKVAKLYKDIAKCYSDHTTKLRTLKSEQADKDLVLRVVEETNFSEKAATFYQTLASDVLTEGASREPEFETQKVKHKVADLSSEYDILRVNLSRKYGKQFPTLEDTAGESESGTGSGKSKKSETAANDAGGKGDSSSGSGKRSAMRTWTDRSGTHHIEAKFLGMEDGKAKLEKADGKIIRVTPESLSPADRRFIGEE
jgi:hypothetical protein